MAALRQLIEWSGSRSDRAAEVGGPRPPPQLLVRPLSDRESR